MRGINKGFLQPDGSTLGVLRNLSFDLGEGQIMGLMGGNGSGKTTLLNIISGELAPDSGSIALNSNRIDRLAAYRRYRFIGRVHQESYKALAADLTVAEVLAIAARRGRRLRLVHTGTIASPPSVVQDVPSVIQFIKERGQVATRLLSGGQRQLLAIIVSVLGKPKLLLLDEHLASLDAAYVDVADQLVRSARTKHNMAVLAVSHNADWVHSFCDRAVRLVDGNIQEVTDNIK